MKKTFDYISVLLFFSLTLAVAVYTFIFSEGSEEISISELPKSTENYVARNFPLTENWRSLYSLIITSVGQNRIGDVYVSENGMIELLSSIDQDKTDRRTADFNELAEAHPGVSSFALIVPTASGIYSSLLPVVITTIDQQKLIDDIYYKLDNSIQTLDAFNPLFSARDDYVYFRTDNSWTEYGAYTVYSKIIRKMGFTPIRLSSYDMEYAEREYYGDLYRKTFYRGTNPDFINIFRNKNGSFVTGFSAWSEGEEFSSASIYYTPALNSGNKLDVFLGGNSFEKYRITTSNTNAPRLLIIKGDYANMFVPFLTPHYSEITMIDPEKLGDKTIEQAVDVDSYDQMLLLSDVDSFCR